MNKRLAMGILVVITLSIAFIPFASSTPAVKVSDGQICAIGETTTINLTLSEAPNGLSGYNLTISLSNISIAEITSVSYPSWASLHSNSSIPADSVWIKCVDLGDQIKQNDTNVSLATVEIKGKAKGKCDILLAVTKIDDDNGDPISVSTISGHLEVAILRFDTGSGTYPSISGTHNGTITPSCDINVNRLFTYSCEGTGGHTEYVRIWNSTGWNVTATWNGYKGDWHNITFDEPFTLKADEEYNYTITTGSYPQIHHTDALLTANGWINCTEFTDANGKRYNNWIPAIKLE